MTTKSDSDADADLQPQGASPGPDPSDPTADADAVAGDHGSGAAAQSARLRMAQSLNDLPTAREYLRHIGAEVRGLWSATVSEREGRYSRDRATIRLTREGAEWRLAVRAADGENAADFEPDGDKRLLILAEAAAAVWPVPTTPHSARNLPDALREAERAGDLFEFRTMPDAAGRSQIIMLQQRVEKPEGKAYLPWTYWNDNQWRRLEPDGPLPLWGLEQLKNNSIVFLHEGAKAARAVRQMVEAATPEAKAALADHPWGKELQHAAHLGWIGGALNPHRTDWSPLANAERIVIVADNDGPGHDAVPKIARLLAAYPVTVEAVRFTTEQWPLSFDLADKFPAKLFKQGRYAGPSMRDCTLPATQATRLGNLPAATGRGRPSAPPIILRQEFAALWVQIVTPSGTMFAPKHNPALLFNPQQFDAINRVFSHVRRLSEVFEAQAYKSIVHGIAYEPGRLPGIINLDGQRVLNTHMPPHIAPWKDTSGIWEQFLEHLFPDEEDRHEFCRWLATLVALPSVRMMYGVLLVSVTQGVGKSTLFDIVCALVGLQNCSTPSASLIVNSDFNGWLARKRLVAVHEIYEGGSWKAYNRLKSSITDELLLVNEKFTATYTVRNQAHFLLGSNSERALMIEQSDRRWLVPRVTEAKHPDGDAGFWARFHGWLASGGHGAIVHWAQEFVKGKGHAVRPGETAPSTKRKSQLIEDSRSAEERATLDLAEMAKAQGQPVILVEQDYLPWVRAAGGERRAGSDMPAQTIRRWLASAGLHICKHDERPKVDGRNQYIAATQPLSGDSPLAGRGWAELKQYRRKPDDLGGM